MPVTSAKCGKTAVRNSLLVLGVYFLFGWENHLLGEFFSQSECLTYALVKIIEMLFCEHEHNLRSRMKNLSCWKRTWALRPVIAKVRVRFSVKPEFFQAFSQPLRSFTAAKIIFTFISLFVVQNYDSFHFTWRRSVLLIRLTVKMQGSGLTLLPVTFHRKG